MSKSKKENPTAYQLQINGEVLSKDSYDRFKDEYGAERAQGYITAVRSFNLALREVLGAGYDGTSGVPPSYSTKVRKSVVKLFDHNEEFLTLVTGKGTDFNSLKP